MGLVAPPHEGQRRPFGNVRYATEVVTTRSINRMPTTAINTNTDSLLEAVHIPHLEYYLQ